jgi:hypothetical protein
MDEKPDNPYQSRRHPPAAIAYAVRLQQAIYLAMGLGFSILLVDAIATSGPQWISYAVGPVFVCGFLASVIYAVLFGIFGSRK